MKLKNIIKIFIKKRVGKSMESSNFLSFFKNIFPAHPWFTPSFSYPVNLPQVPKETCEPCVSNSLLHFQLRSEYRDEKERSADLKERLTFAEEELKDASDAIESLKNDLTRHTTTSEKSRPFTRELNGY